MHDPLTSRQQLTLATYNIHACIGGDKRFDPARIAAVINELDADVIALQEVEHHLLEKQDLLAVLAQQTGYQAIAGPASLREDRDYGNGLLTRLPIEKVSQLDISVPNVEPRAAIQATLRYQQHRLQIMATHLGLKPFERRIQVKKLLAAHMYQSDADISVMMGDVNEWFLWGRPLRWLHQQYAPQPHLATFPAKFPLFALDRIWVSPQDKKVILKVHRTPLAKLASDHLPLIAQLTV